MNAGHLCGFDGRQLMLGDLKRWLFERDQDAGLVVHQGRFLCVRCEPIQGLCGFLVLIAHPIISRVR